MSQPSINHEELVPMGGIGVGSSSGVLRTLLGSCIGIALYERRLKVVGLAHVVMPDSMGRTSSLGKYADTAIPETIRKMMTLAGVGGKRLDLSAKIAGGANMFAQTSGTGTVPIGEQNRIAVEEVLKKLNIPILARHVGGTTGRRMLIDIATCTVQIQVVGQSVIEI